VSKNGSIIGTQPAKSVETFQQMAYDFVKSRIMNLEFKPGQRVKDSQIADDLNISRTPVRDALRLLEHEGFLISEARQGWKVYSLSLEDIHEIFDIKMALESMITGQAAECDDEEKRATLRGIMKRMKQAAKANDDEAWIEADRELHDTIFSMSSNERASRIIRNLNEQWWRVRIGFLAMQGRIDRSNPEHEAIVESILAGDSEEAERLMRVHLNNLREELVRLLVNLVFPFAQEGV